MTTRAEPDTGYHQSEVLRRSNNVREANGRTRENFRKSTRHDFKEDVGRQIRFGLYRMVRASPCTPSLAHPYFFVVKHGTEAAELEPRRTPRLDQLSS